MTALDTTTLAADIYKLLGPKENILIAENCMTRLRLQLKKKDIASLAALKKMPGVLGINEPSANELQIILGPGRAAQVADAFQKLLKAPADAKTVCNITKQKPQIGDGHKLHSAIRTKNATPGKLFLKRIASIFMPIIPAFIGCGLITGLLNVILKIDPSLGNIAAIQLLQIAGNAAFWGINIFVGINAAKEFEASPILGGVMAVIITHPGLSSISLFNETLVPGRGGIMAVLLVVAFSSWLEKKLHHMIPEMFDL
ncbi:MAG: PTS transporter subunit EIIC, partial [Selenomonadaceae bacterium]